jgi:succinate dehydrogenase / fumarate reductase membrane anchor subunit
MSMAQERIRRSIFLWLLQRITAVLLVVLLGLHLWTSNFATDWAPLLRTVVDISLLALTLFHGLNGIRTIVLDFGLGYQARRFLLVSLWMLGFVAFLFGMYGVWELLVAS